jgi:hypothetical protein
MSAWRGILQNHAWVNPELVLSLGL